MIRTSTENKEPGSAQIVVVTGRSDSENIEKGGVPAGVPVLNNPIPFDELKAMLNKKPGLMVQ